MFWVLAVMIFGLMFMGAGLHLDPIFVFFLFVFLMVWMSVRLMVGFVRWISGADAAEIERERRHRQALARRPCTDPHCGRVNVPGARFCAQCGRRLR